MSAKSKRPSKSTGSQALDRPFDPAIWRRAQQIAKQYRVIIEFVDGEYYGHGFEMPFVMADGKTPAACFESTQEALALAVAVHLEKGKQPPAPASDEKRTEQVNLRLTALEKARLEEASRQQGFRGVSDYVRAKALG